MPRVVGGDHDGINIFALEQLPMVAITVSILEFGLFLCPITALVENIAYGSDHCIVFTSLLMNPLQMVFPDAEANAYDPNGNAVIRAGHPCRRRLILPIHGRA